MKTSLRLFSVFALIAIYFFAIDFSFPSAPGGSYTENNSSKEKHISAVSNAHVFATQSANASITIVNSVFSSLKNPFHDYVAIVTFPYVFDRSTFTQYVRSSLNFSVDHKKTDIIYPTHYFW